MSFDSEKLRKLLSGRAMIFCHHNADPDSICSAYAFKELSEKLSPFLDSEIVLPGGASSLSRRVMKAIGIKTVTDALIEEADILIILDVGTMSQLENWVEKVTLSDVPKVFIDHHAPHPEIMQLSTIYLVNEDATSTCEIVYELYKNFGVKPSASVAKALLTGIAFDSKHFKIGTSKSFEAISELLEIDGNAQEIIGLISSEKSRSERIARLKAGQRLQLYEIEGWIVVTSHVSSFQASAARSLLALGADVAIVAGGENGVVKVSLRSTFRYYRESSIHLGVDVAKPLGEQFDGSGSGHTTAAGVNAKGMYKHILNRAVELLVSSHK